MHSNEQAAEAHSSSCGTWLAAALHGAGLSSGGMSQSLGSPGPERYTAWWLSTGDSSLSWAAVLR